MRHLVALSGGKDSTALARPVTDNPWGGEGTCKAEHAIGDAGYFRLTCSLPDNHPELHWDRNHFVVWVDWSEADEAETPR